MSRHVGVFGAGHTTSTAQIEVSAKFADSNGDAAQALYLVVDVTSGTPAMIVTVSGYDETSGRGFPLLVSSAISAGTNVLKVGPQLTAGANVAKEYLPHAWYVTVSGGAAGTYSIGASVI